MTTKSILTGATLLSLFTNVFSANIKLPEYRSSHENQEDITLIGRYHCSVYYKSSVTANWPNAKDFCRNSFESNATLVSVETVEELQRLHVMLDDDYDGIIDFWVNGQWKDGCYRWMSTKEYVDEGDVVHWFDNDRPYGEVNLRLLLVYQGTDTDTTFKAANWRKAEKFICEVPIEGSPECL